MDKDLSSVQEARDLVARAYEAWKAWSRASQADVDRVCAAMAEAGYRASERLGRLAQEETGYGVALHKKLKNEFSSRMVWNSLRDMKTVGVIRHDPERRLYEIAWPMGVIAALIPSTNPTSTTFFKALIAVKARDAIIFAPHPSAGRCINEAAQTMALAAESAGAPAGSRYQFERLGYFCVDADSTPDKIVFNRTVTLRDSWARMEKKDKMDIKKTP